MCYHASRNYEISELEAYYNLTGGKFAFDKWQRLYHDNGFDHNPSPILLKEGLGYFQWGLIPWYSKPEQKFQ